MKIEHPLSQKCVRIMTNGTLKGTRIYLPDGTDISALVRTVHWEIGADGVARATLGLVAATLEAALPPGEEATS